MTLANLVAGKGRAAAFAAAIAGTVGAVSIPQPAHAVSPGAAVGIGLGSFFLGSALGAAANPYYYPYYGYPYYYPPASYYYYPPRPYYAPPPRCYSPYYGYYPC